MDFMARRGRRYVNRGDPAEHDWEIGDLTLDAAYHILDLSPIVGKGKRLVVMNIVAIGNAANRKCFFKTNGNTNLISVASLYTQSGGIGMANEFTVYTDKDGKIEYMFHAAVFSLVRLNVRGWWK